MAEFSNLTEAEQARYNSASKAERKQMTIEFRQSQKTPPEEPVTGTVVEPGQEEVVSPEEKQTRAQRRAAAKAAKEAELAQLKKDAEAYAAKLYSPDELSDFERQHIKSVIGEDDKPFFRNRKAQKELREAFAERTMDAVKESQAYKDAINKALQEVQNAVNTGDQDKIEQAQIKLKELQDFYEQMAERGAKVRVKDMATGDKVEHTRVFDSGAEKRDARKALGDEADGLRLKVHNKKFIGDDNVNLHSAVEQGVSSHEAAYNLSKDISGDRTYEPNEAQNFAAKSSNEQSHDAAARKELRKLGFDVKDDTLKNIAKGVAVGVLSQVGTAALPVAVNAFAEAFVRNSVTGEILAYDSDSESTQYVNWKGMGIGAAVGTAVAAAMFPKTQDEDVLHGVGVQEIFMDAPNGERAYENMSFGSKNDTLRVKTLMRAIDELDLTDEQKTQFLIDAAGEDGQRILSKKELAIAYVKAYEQTLPDKETIEVPPLPELDDIEIEDEPIQIQDENLDFGDGGKTKVPYMVFINNNDTYDKIAKRFGVELEALIKLNENVKGQKSGHIDCEELAHKYLVAGKPVKIPGEANADIIEDYTEEFTPERIRSDYIKSVTGDEFLEKNRDCYRNIKAAGPEAEKAFKEKMIKEAKEAGLTIPTEYKDGAELARDLRDSIKDLKTVVENQKKYLKDTYGIDYDPGDKTLKQQTEEMLKLIEAKEKEAQVAEKESRIAEIEEQLKTPMIDPDVEKSLKAELEELTGREARAAEILKEFQGLQGPVAPEILNELNEEYQKLTGEPLPGFSGQWTVKMPPKNEKKADDIAVKPEETPKSAEQLKSESEAKAKDRAAEILQELQSSVISPEYADELRAEYQKLTGKPLPVKSGGMWSADFNPFI